MTARVEFFPFGESRLEACGIPFRDRTFPNGDVARDRNPAPTSAKILSIKSEDSEGGGPVWIDGEPYAEIRFADLDSWSVVWYTRAEARRMAKKLGAELAEA